MTAMNGPGVPVEPQPNPYAGQSDEELYRMANSVMRAAIAEPPGTAERAKQFAAHERIMRELGRRLLNQWLLSIREQLGLPPLN